MGYDVLPDLDKVGHQAWAVACVEYAQSLNAPSGPAGALGFLLSDEDYAGLMAGAVFAPLEKPEDIDAPGYKQRKRDYDQEQQAKAALRRELFASIPTPVLELTPGYDSTFGTVRLDLRVVWEAVRRRAIFSSHTLYEGALAKLAVPYEMGTSMETHISRQAALHRECKAMGFPLNQGDKLRFFIRGLGGYGGPFATTLTVWEEEVGRIPEQRTFEDGDGAPTPPPQPAVDSKGRKKGGAAPAQAGPSYEGLATVVRRAAMRFPPSATATAATFGSHVQGRAPPQAMTAAAPMQKRNADWCWTHGRCHHSGKDCKRPAPGHRPEATATRPLGGPAPQRSR